MNASALLKAARLLLVGLCFYAFNSQAQDVKSQPRKAIFQVKYTSNSKVDEIGYVLDANAVPSHVYYTRQGDDSKFLAYPLNQLVRPQTLKGKGDKVAAQLQLNGNVLKVLYIDDARDGMPNQSHAFTINYNNWTHAYYAVDNMTGKMMKQVTIEPETALGGFVEVGVKKLTVQ